jgi:hypothetical protein
MKHKLIVALLALIISIGFITQGKAQTIPAWNSNIVLKDFGYYASNFYMAPGDATGVPTFIYGYYYTCYNRAAVYKGYWVSGSVGYATVEVNSNGTLFQFTYPLYYYDSWSNTYTYFIQ